MENYKVQIDDEIIEGTAIDIVKRLRSKRFHGEDIELEDYLLEMAQNIWRLYEESIILDQDPTLSIEVKCDRFINQVILFGLLKSVE